MNFKAFAQQRKSPTKQKDNREWEKISANNATNKKLISKIYKQLTELNINETNKQSNQKNGSIKNLNRYLSRGDTDGQKAHEKMLNIINY